MPIVEAELADGTILEFPEGTADDVIDRAVKEHLGLGQISAPAQDLALRNNQMLSGMLQQDVQAHPQPQQPEQPARPFNINAPVGTPEEQKQQENLLLSGAYQPSESDVARATKQAGVQMGLGLVSPLRMAASAFGADSGAARKLADVEQSLTGMMDAANVKDMQTAQAIRKQAQDKGIWDQVVAEWDAIKAEPQALGRLAIGVLPFMAAAIAGPEASAGVGVATGLGGVKESIFEGVRNEVAEKLIREGVDQKTAIDRATEIADKAQAYNGENLDSIVAGGILGLVTAGKASEITGSVMQGMAEKGLLQATAESAATLGVLGAQSKEAENLALGREGFDVPQFRGVPGAFAQGAIPGLGLGVMHGAQPGRPNMFESYKESTGFRPEDYRAEPAYTPEEPRQLRGPTDESARTDTGIQPPGADDTGAGARLPIPSEEGTQEGPTGETEVSTRGGMGVPGGDLGPTGGAEGREPSALDLINKELENKYTSYDDEGRIVSAPATEETKTTEAIIKEPPKITQPTVPGQFQLGDLVRYGNESGTVIGVDGNYVKMQPAGAKNAKAYRKIPVNKLEFVSRPDLSLSSSASKKEELGQEAGQLKMDTEEMVERFGRGMYGAATAEMIAKELLQNSFDAVKGAASTVDSKGNKITPKYKVGNIELILDRKNRTITIKDDGVGMTPAIVRDALFTVAGSEKSNLPPEERSGGLGLAKLGALTGATRYVVDTVRDGIRTQVDASTKDIIRSNFTINKIAAEEGEHGTTITAYIPETYTKPQTGEELSIYFPDETPDALKKPLIGPANIIVKYRSGWGGDKFETYNPGVGANFPYDDYQKFDVDKIFNHSRAEVYVGKERTKSPKHRVLSSGVYQFDTRFMLSQSEQIPYDIIINIKSKVPASSEDYPFTNTREAFKPRFEEDVSALSQYLASYARGEEARDLAETFQDLVTLPRTEVGEEVADTSNKLKKAFEKKGISQESHKLPPMPTNVTIGGGQVLDKSNKVLLDTDKERQRKQKAEKVEKKSFTESKDKPKKATDYMMEMTHDPSQPIFHNNTSVDYIEIGRQYGDPEKFFAELATLVLEMKEALADSGMYGYDKISNKNLYFAGIAIDKKYGGLFTIVPLKSILINPFYDWGATTLSGVRRNIVTTIVHEIAHTNDMSHGVGHNNQMMRVEQHLEDVGLWDYLNDAVSDILTRHESTFTAMRDAYGRSTTKNTAKSFEDYEGNTPARTTGRGTTGANNQSGAVPAGGGQGGSGAVPPTSGAGNAGGVGRGTGTSTAKQNQLDATERKIATSEDVFDKNVGVGDLVLEAKDFKDRLKVLKAWLNAGDVLRIKAILPTMPTDQIIRWVGDKIPQLEEVGTIKINMDSARLKRVQRNNEVLEKLVKFASINTHKLATMDFLGLRELADMMHTATLRNVDPTLHTNLQQALLGDEELVDLRAELSKATPAKAPSVKRQITMRENSITKAYGAWNRLGLIKGGRELFKEVKDIYEEDHRDYVKLLFDIAENSALPGSAKDPTSEKGKLMAAIRMRFVESKKIPVYFPLSHVGKYWVRIGKGVAGQTTMFNTATARNRYVDKYVESSGKTKTELMRSEAIDFGDDVRSLRTTDKSITSDKLLTEIFDLLDKNAKGAGNALSTSVDVEDIKDAVFQLFFRGLPGGDIRSRYTKRKGKAGFSADIIQSFALLTNTAAGQLARLKYEGPIKRKLEEAYEHIKSDPNKLALTPFIDEISKKMDVELGGNKSLNSLENSIVNFGSKVVFFTFLTKPKQFLVQLTQLPIVGYPTLMRDYGAANATAVSVRYMDLYHKLGVTEDADNIDPDTGKRVSPIRPFTDSPKGFIKDFYLSNVSLGNSQYVNDRVLLKHTFNWADEQLNMFSNTNTVDISGRSTTPTKVNEGVLSKGTRNMLNFMGAAIHHGERFSREFMFMSAFELAFEDELKKRSLPSYKEYVKANYVPLELRKALAELDQIEDAFDIEKGSANRKAQSPLAQAIERARYRATKTTYDALFNYSPFNKPRLMTGMGVLPALGTKLMMYPISMVHVLFVNGFRIMPKYREFGKVEYERQFKAAKEEGLNDTDADTRARAKTIQEKDKIRKQRRDAAVQLFGVEGMQFLFGGLRGSFLVLAMLGVLDVLKNAFVDDDTYDAEEQEDESNPLSKKMDTYDWFINYGIPEIFGTPEDPFAEQPGWRNVVSRSLTEGPISKGTGVNIGASTGFNTLFFVNSNKADAKETSDSIKLWAFDQTFGAPAAATLQYVDAWNTGYETGEWGRALEKSPWLFGTAAKAFRHATEGEITPSGIKMQDKDWFNLGKTIVDTAGFGHTDIAEMQRQTQLYFKYKPEADAARAKVFDAYNKARIWEEKNESKLDDPKTSKAANAYLDKLYDEADKLQDKYADSPYGQLLPIKPGSIKLSLDEKAKSRMEIKDTQREFLGKPPIE